MIIVYICNRTKCPPAQCAIFKKIQDTNCAGPAQLTFCMHVCAGPALSATSPKPSFAKEKASNRAKRRKSRGESPRANLTLLQHEQIVLEDANLRAICAGEHIARCAPPKLVTHAVKEQNVRLWEIVRH